MKLRAKKDVYTFPLGSMLVVFDKDVVMSSDRLGFLVFAYTLLVWACALLLVGVGLTGLLAPDRLRKGLKAIGVGRYLRLIGVALMLVGAAMMLRSSRPDANLLMPRLGFWLGLLVCLKGVPYLLFPAVVQWVMDFHCARPDAWQRLLGLVCLGVSILFFLALRTTSVSPF